MQSSRALRKSSPLAELLSKVQLEDQRRAALRKSNESKSIEQLLDESRARCQTLIGFIREAWHILEPRTKYVHGEHIDAIGNHLEAVSDGRINRLLINVPPGFSKSLIVSVFWPAWEWGPKGNSALRYLTTSYNDGPVKRDSRQTRDLILSEWYQERWPHVRLTRTGEMSFSNDATGWREGSPFGSLTSKRGDRLLIDDPQSVKTAEQKALIVETTRLFREGALNRLNDQERSAIVIIMQRLATNDISEAALDFMSGIVHLRLPMEFEKSAACQTKIGFRDWRTVEGELLEPIRFPREVVDDLKRGMGAHAYASQYQQRPTAREGGMFQRSWFEGKIIDALPQGITRRVRKWDLAASAPDDSADPDFTASLKMSTDGHAYYIEYVTELQKGPNEVRKAIRDTAALDGPSVHIRIPQDPGQAGKDQSQSIIAENAGYIISAERETGDKGTRAEPFAAQCEAGNVFLLRGDWCEGLVDQLCNFPKGHDDKVDCASGAFNYLAGMPASSFFDLEKLLVKGFPVPVPRKQDGAFAVISTAVKTGKDSDSAGVVYFATRKIVGHPLTIVDWALAPADAALIDTWIAEVFARLQELATECGAAPMGVFIHNRDAGSIIMQHANRRGLRAVPIPDELAKLGRNERAINVASYIERQMVKIDGPAFEKRMDFAGQNRNHLTDQVTAFRIDDKDHGKTSADLLDGVMYGIALALGGADGV